jgi:hypothetical protein
MRVQGRLRNAEDNIPFYTEAEATLNEAEPLYANRTDTLPPFTTIQACLPFNFAVGPSPPAKYAITTVGEEDVLDAISYVVADDTLVLSTDGNFNTTGGVKLTVSPLLDPSPPASGINLHYRTYPPSFGSTFVSCSLILLTILHNCKVIMWLQMQFNHM